MIKTDSKLSVALEFLLLTAIVTLVAISGSAISRILGSNHDVPFEVAACFLFALLVYHLWFYCLRRYHTKNVTKFIDYLYLGVTTVGLLAAGLEFSRQQSEADVRAAYERALDSLNLFPMTVEDQAYFCDQLKDTSDKCRSFHIIPTNFRFRLNEVKSKPTIDGVEGLRRWSEAVQQEYKIIDNPEDSFLTPHVVNFRSFVESLKGNRFTQASQGALAQYRFFAFFLLAAALAIRITKVSIELFEWYRPDPK